MRLFAYGISSFGDKDEIVLEKVSVFGPVMGALLIVSSKED